MLRISPIVVLVLSFFAPHASASTVFDQTGDRLLLAGYFSDRDTADQQIADDFTLASAATITQVTFSGIYAAADTPIFPQTFIVRFFADDGTTTAPLLAPLVDFSVAGLTGMDTGIDETGSGSFRDVYEFSAPIPGFAAVAGTQYWLSVVADTSADVDDDFAWVDNSLALGNPVVRFGDAGAWTGASEGGDQSFSLSTAETVPEPSTFAMAALGLLSLGFVAWRKKYRRA